METIKTIPGRGLVTPLATKMRLEYLSELGIKTDKLEKTSIQVDEIQNNIESFIGSIEVPVGIVGPLLFNNDATQELAYCAIGTLEGALVSSMNRGAKVISQSGGFTATVHWQKMTRAPMFLFEDTVQA
ncbi:MAG TPA: hypothetical protein VL947_14225, partial [Cytophagales bacterium]|nr:hypothetical protein [Cytophagales bacterium]